MFNDPKLNQYKEFPILITTTTTKSNKQNIPFNLHSSLQFLPSHGIAALPHTSLSRHLPLQTPLNPLSTPSCNSSNGNIDNHPFSRSTPTRSFPSPPIHRKDVRLWTNHSALSLDSSPHRSEVAHNELPLCAVGDNIENNAQYSDSIHAAAALFSHDPPQIHTENPQ